jgi:hypothetical protein
MNALPSFTDSPQTTKARKHKHQSRAVASRRLHRSLAMEATTKLMVYTLLSGFGVAALANLIQYNSSQQSKLHYVQGALKTTQNRADRVNRDFIRSFDGRATKSLMEENSYKVPSDRQPIAIVDPPRQENSHPTTHDRQSSSK